MNEASYEASFRDKKGKQFLVYVVLKDRQWHCRDCEYDHVATTQLAGSLRDQGIAQRFNDQGRAGNQERKQILRKL